MSTSTSKVIAAIYAHPDDGEFFAAGSLAKWAKAGHRVHAICATRGDLAASAARSRGTSWRNKGLPS